VKDRGKMIEGIAKDIKIKGLMRWRRQDIWPIELKRKITLGTYHR